MTDFIRQIIWADYKAGGCSAEERDRTLRLLDEEEMKLQMEKPVGVDEQLLELKLWRSN